MNDLQEQETIQTNKTETRTEALSTMPPEMIKENPLKGDNPVLPNNTKIVCDERLWTKLGGSVLKGRVLKGKLSSNVVMVQYGTDCLTSMDPGCMLLFDAATAAGFATSVQAAFNKGPLDTMAVLPLVDIEDFASQVMLDRMNLTIQCCWMAGLRVMKPRVMKPFTDRKSIVGQSVPVSAPTDKISVLSRMIIQAQTNFGEFISSGSDKGLRLIGIHSSGKVVTGGPVAPVEATLEQVGSPDFCDHLRVLKESPTWLVAKEAWAPTKAWRDQGECEPTRKKPTKKKQEKEENRANKKMVTVNIDTKGVPLNFEQKSVLNQRFSQYGHILGIRYWGSSKTSCRISFGTAKSARMAAFHENGTFFFNCQVTANIARSNKKELEARTKTRGKRGGQKKHTPRPLLNERTAKSTNAKPADLQTLFTNNKPGVLVSNLDPSTPAHILVKLFGDQGNVLNFQELFESNSSFEKGFCSIKYETYEECQNAIRKLDNYMFNGRIISVQFEDEGEVANLNVEHQKNDKQLNYDRTHSGLPAPTAPCLPAPTAPTAPRLTAPPALTAPRLTAPPALTAPRLYAPPAPTAPRLTAPPALTAPRLHAPPAPTAPRLPAPHVPTAPCLSAPPAPTTPKQKSPPIRPNIVEIVISDEPEVLEYGKWIRDQLLDVGVSRVGLTMSSVGYSLKEIFEEMASRGIKFVCVFTLEDAKQRILSVKSLRYEKETILTGPAEKGLTFIRTNYFKESYFLPPDLRWLCAVVYNRHELTIEEYDNFISFMVDYREHKIKEIHGTEVMAELLEPPLQLNQDPVAKSKQLEVQAVLLNVLERNKNLLPLSTCRAMPSAPSDNRAIDPPNNIDIVPFSDRHVPRPAPYIDVGVQPPAPFINVGVPPPGPYIDVGVPPPVPYAYIGVGVPPPAPYPNVAVPPPVLYNDRNADYGDRDDKRDRDVPYRHRDSYSPSRRRDRDAPSRRRGNRSRVRKDRSRDRHSRRRDSPSRRRDSPLRRRDSPLRRRDSPSRRRDSPSRRRDSPSRRRDSLSRRRDSPSRCTTVLPLPSSDLRNKLGEAKREDSVDSVESDCLILY